LTASRHQCRETLAISELSESHRQKLIPARQASVVMIAIIAGFTFLELDVGEVANQLRENGSTDIHPTIVPSPRWDAI
jgi:hypothetical protein